MRKLWCWRSGLCDVPWTTCWPNYEQIFREWSGHRNNWSRPDDKDEIALSPHYSVLHSIVNKPPIHEACTAAFTEQPSFHSLDKCEDKWYHQLDAQINIQNMILPRVKSFLLSFALFVDMFLTLFTTNVLAMLLSSLASVLNAHASVWLPSLCMQYCFRILPTFWIIRRVMLPCSMIVLWNRATQLF